MVTFLLLAALGVVVLLSTTRAEASSETPEGDPMLAWQKAIQDAVPNKPLPQLPGATPDVTSPGTISTSSGDQPMSDAETQAWIDFYKKSARTSGSGANVPPEYPTSAHDLGSEGDLDRMNEALREEVVYALFYQGDTHTLSMLADDVEANGFPIAANRLRQKALRMVDRVGSPETSPMPMSAES